jgi:hypothetical protein
MNGPEFFMLHAGYRLLPSSLRTEDAVNDAEALFGLSLPLHTGKTLRLSSCWMVVTPAWVATSFKVLATTGFRLDLPRKEAIAAALKAGEPCMLLQLGKRTLRATDLFVTYDPRAARICEQGNVTTFDATKDKAWTS